MKKFTLSFLFVMISSLMLAGKPTGLEGKAMIMGHISEESTGQELSGVKVIIEGSDLFTYSDENGNFQFTELPQGKIILVYSLVSFETQKREFEMLPGELVQLEIKLAER